MNLTTKTILITLTLIFLPNAVEAATISRPMHNAGLVAYWPMDEGVGIDVFDRSGNLNHGTTTGMDDFDWVSGKHGGALDFDGTNDEINAGNSASLDIVNAITVSAWVYRTGLSDGIWIGIVAKGGFNLNRGFELLINDDNDYPDFIINNVQAVDTGFKLNNNRWYHLTGVYDGTNVFLYVDGILIDSSGPVTMSSSINDDLIIGRRDAGNSDPATLNGKIDEVRIYNRALSADEVRRLYNLGRPLIGTSPKNRITNGLVGYWTFDGKDMTPNVLDVSGQGNHGDLNGQTSTTTTIGKVGQALDFDGVDDVVKIIGGDAELDIGTSDHTVSAWIKVPPQGSQEGLIAADGAGNSTTAGFWFSVREDGVNVGKLQINVSNGSSNVVNFSSVSLVDDNIWHHVVWVWDRDVGNFAYIDGVEDNTDSSTNSDNIGSDYTGLGIGDRTNSTLRPMDGKIDDVRIYDRALSADEVLALYNITKGTDFNKTKKNRITDGLVGYWTFDGSDTDTVSAADSSGQGNDGTLNGGPVPAIGKIGQAIKFDGIDDIITVSGTNKPTVDEVTISAWVKINNFRSANHHVIASDISGNNGFYMTIYRASATNRLYLSVRNGTSSETHYATIDGGLLEFGRWYHIAAKYDKTAEEISYYVNGVKDSEVDTVAGGFGSIAQNTQNMDIGHDTSISTSQFDGTIDDLRIYNRALSADEITALYNMGR